MHASYAPRPTPNTHHQTGDGMALASVSQLDAALLRYEEALLRKGKEDLRDVDRWYRGELRKDLLERSTSDGGAYLTHDEMVRLIKWKLTRGKFRPALEGYVRGNARDLVHSSSQETFAVLPPDFHDVDLPDESTIKEAMKAACKMKGVGPALSSALLALARPNTLPYMADEVIVHGVGILTPPKYSDKEYVILARKVNERMEQLRKENGNEKAKCLQTAEQFEMASWAYGVLKVKDAMDELTASNKSNMQVTKSKSKANEESAPSVPQRKRRKR